MNTVQVVSDLHLDQLESYRINELIVPKSEILILGGDICHFSLIHNHEHFFNYISLHFQYVLYIPGNHEFYNKGNHTLKDIEKFARNYFKKYKNIIYLNNESIFIEDILFTGSCLWCKPELDPPIWFMIDITKDEIHELYDSSIAYLEKISKLCYPKHVVITHYPPIFIEKTKYRKCGKYDDYYQNSTITLPHSPRFWIFGHIHENMAKEYNKTIYLSNQRKDKNYSNTFTFRI